MYKYRFIYHATLNLQLWGIYGEFRCGVRKVFGGHTHFEEELVINEGL